MAVFSSFFLFIAVSCNSFLNQPLYHDLSTNLNNSIALVVCFIKWIVSPFFIEVVNFYGLVLSFQFSPFGMWSFGWLIYLMLFTYYKTSISLGNTLFLCISLCLCFFWGFLPFHETLAPAVLIITLSFVSFVIFFLYYFNRKNTKYEDYLLQIESSPHIPTAIPNLVKAFALVPVPVSVWDRFLKLIYYDTIFAVIGFIGLVKTNFIVAIVLTRYLFSNANFYYILPAIIWFSLALALLVFDSHWAKDFKKYNGQKVLYLLGYNNTYKHLYSILRLVGISSLFTSFFGFCG